MTALISARWVNACGKLPRWRPRARVDLLGVELRAGWRYESSFSHSSRARSSSPISTSADTSQNEQIVNVPSSPLEPVVGLLDAVAQHEPVLGQLVGDREHGVADALVVGGQEAHERHQQHRGVERVVLVVLAEHAALVERVARRCRP